MTKNNKNSNNMVNNSLTNIKDSLPTEKENIPASTNLKRSQPQGTVTGIANTSSVTSINQSLPPKPSKPDTDKK